MAWGGAAWPDVDVKPPSRLSSRSERHSTLGDTGSKQCKQGHPTHPTRYPSHQCWTQTRSHGTTGRSETWGRDRQGQPWLLACSPFELGYSRDKQAGQGAGGKEKKKEGLGRETGAGAEVCDCDVAGEEE